MSKRNLIEIEEVIENNEKVKELLEEKNKRGGSNNRKKMDDRSTPSGYLEYIYGVLKQRALRENKKLTDEIQLILKKDRH